MDRWEERTEHGVLIEALVESDNLKMLQEEIRQCNISKGWFDKERSFGDAIALLHSEVSEALEAFRDFGVGDVYRAPDGQFVAEFRTDPYMEIPTLNKPEGIGSECADVLIRLLDLCERFNVDLFAKTREKLDYNWSRPFRHGGKAL